ncbi:MAG: protoporphyrinogen oxidase [Kofleriaceae bacterium]
MSRVAVVGGGLAGLCAAHRLVEAGHEVVVYEAAARVGGVVGTRADDGWRLETAASAFLAGADDGLAALCAELGVPVHAASAVARRRYVYIDGRRRIIPTNPLALARTDLLTWRGKLELLREPWRPRGEAGDESVHALAARRLGPEAARALVAPMVTGVFAARAHDVGVAAGFPRLAALVAEGGLVRGALKAAWRQRGRKRPRGLAAPADGLGAVVAALASRLGARVRCGQVVSAVGEGRVIIGDQVHRHDAIVLATPARVSAGLVEDAAPELAARLAELRRAPTAVVYLGYPAAAVAAAADGFGVLVADGEAPRVLGVVFESTLWPGRAPAGQALLRCIYGGARDPGVLDQDDAGLLAQAERDVAAVLGVDATPTRREVVRWRDGIAAYPVGHRDRVATLDTLAHRSRWVLAGADYHGVGVNDVCADARRVVAEVAA